MNLLEYENQFEEILSGDNTDYFYDSDDYLNYTALNKA